MDNYQMYENYKEQFKRLDRALRYEFYLEALFIEYAILRTGRSRSSDMQVKGMRI